MKLRVAASSGWPGDCKTSSTIGGAPKTSWSSVAFRCSVSSSFFFGSSAFPSSRFGLAGSSRCTALPWPNELIALRPAIPPRMIVSATRSASCSYRSPGSLIASFRCRARRLRLHCSHSPVGPGVPPQAHLRCSKPACTGVLARLAVFCGSRMARSFTSQAPLKSNLTFVLIFMGSPPVRQISSC